MKIKTFLLVVTVFSAFGFLPQTTLALTPAELAGKYSGTVSATSSTGESGSGTISVKFKANGKGKLLLLSSNNLNGSSKFTYQILSDTLMALQDSNGESVGFYELAGNTLSLQLLLKEVDGNFVINSYLLTK